MTRLGLRARLTLFVTVVFAVALSVISMVVLAAVERELLDDTRANAEAVLMGYLESVFGGVATVAVVDRAEATRFFYLDGQSQEITEDQFFDTMYADLNLAFEELIAIEGTVDGVQVLGSDVDYGPYGSSDAVELPISSVILNIDPETGAILEADGSEVIFDFEPQPIGDPHPIDLADNVVAISQSLETFDGTPLQIGVSSPLRPVADSLATIRLLLWFAVPALVVATAMTTWLAAGRALRPVQEITARAQAITAANIGDRVPVHAAHDEIRELATTVNNMLVRLDNSQQEQRRFVADASHELRSPVAASRTQLEVARANPDTTDWVATADVVLAEQEHLSGLVDGLLALSRLDEAGPGPMIDVDLDDLIVAEAARPHPVTIETSVVQPVRAKANAPLLTRALRNLVDNAARHGQSLVLVTLAVNGGESVITVDDDGPGIARQDQERVFARFTRLDEARDRQSGGAGLGLAIAREVARAHGGDVTVTRGPLGGARFTLTLPAEQP